MLFDGVLTGILPHTILQLLLLLSVVGECKRSVSISSSITSSKGPLRHVGIFPPLLVLFQRARNLGKFNSKDD